MHHRKTALQVLLWGWASLAASAAWSEAFGRTDYATAEAGATVTSSSELVRFKGRDYFASHAINGETVGAYWCTDFPAGARSPHWLEVDLGQEREIGEVSLFMRPGQPLHRFRIEAESADRWVEVGGRDAAPPRAGPENLQERYVPGAAPYGVFRVVTPHPLRTRRLRLTIDAPSIARLYEIRVMAPRPAMEPVERTAIDPAGLLRFDFGPAGSPVEDGWTAVTETDAYRAELGYGWVDAEPGLAGLDREVGYPVTRDLVAGVAREGMTVRHVFRVRVPEGRYAVAVAAGDLDFSVPPFSISVGGRVVAPRVGTGDRGGWDTQTFTVSAEGGVLDLAFESEGAWVVSAVVIAPVEQFGEVQAEVDRLEDQYARRDERLVRDLLHRRPDEVPGDLRATAERRDRGFEVFKVPRTRRLYATSVPGEADVIRALDLRVTPGEIGSLTFAMRTLGPLRDVRVEIADLTGPAGRFSAEALDVGWVRCWPQHEEKWDPRGAAFMDVPEMIHPMGRHGELWIAGETTRQFWISVRVPADAPAGAYRGTLTVAAADAPPVELDLAIDVLPFELQWPEPMAWGIYYYPQQMPNPENLIADLRDLRSNGLNMFCFDSGARLRMTDEGPEWNLDELRHIMAAVEEVGGFDAPFPLLIGSALPPGPPEEPRLSVMRAFIRHLESVRAEEGWPEFLYYLYDEPFHAAAIEEAAPYYEAAKQVPGIRTYCTVGWAAVEAFGQWIDVRTHSPTVPQGFEWPRVRDAALEAGAEFWWYTNSTRSHFDVMRMKAGFFHWRIRATGQTYWHYCSPHMSAFTDFDGTTRDHISAYPGLDGPIRTVQWEAHRDGINDAKYAYTLEATLAEARASNAPADAISRAEAALDGLASRVIHDMAYYDEKHPDRRFAFHYYSEWTPEQYDRERADLVDAILELRAALPR